MSKVRLLIVDDQPLIRDGGFKAVLEATGQMVVVGEAGTGEEAIAQAHRHQPDVVLMGVRNGPASLAQLTDRERQVLRLLAVGLSNAEIGARWSSPSRRSRRTSRASFRSSDCATGCRP